MVTDDRSIMEERLSIRQIGGAIVPDEQNEQLEVMIFGRQM
jgi:hypothetical protein